MKYFGTDGIRQKAEKFTPEFLNSVVVGLSDYAGTDIKVLIGGDTRESSEWILQDLASALESLGVEYSSVGILPTPAINYCFYAMGFDFAIDVTASHNPYVDNGIKIFERGASSGVKLSEEGCAAIENAIAAGKTISVVAATDRADLHSEAVELYKAHLFEYLGDVDLHGLHIALDCANGAMSAIADSVFSELGAKVSLLNAKNAYGREINCECGSTHPEKLIAAVLEKGLGFGIAFDGDGDRCLLVDGAGEIVDGDEIIAIVAEYLKLDKIAVTVMANQGLLNWASEHNIATEITAVGDSNVAAAMKLYKIALGGEQSGHIILPGEPTGDGMLTSLLICKIVSETGKSLRELASTMVKLPQVMVNVPASKEQKENLKTSDAVKNVLLEYNKKLEEVSGRLLVRPSGTEDLIRIAMWGDDASKIETLSDELKNKLGEVL